MTKPDYIPSSVTQWLHVGRCAIWKTGFGFHVRCGQLGYAQFERWPKTDEARFDQVGKLYFSVPLRSYWVRDSEGICGFNFQWKGYWHAYGVWQTIKTRWLRYQLAYEWEKLQERFKR